MGKSNGHPFGGVFGLIGFIIGIALGVNLEAGFVGTIVIAFIAASFGLFVEHIVARVLAFAAVVLFILVRNQIIRELLEMFSE